MAFQIRRATHADSGAIRELIALSMSKLLAEVLTPAQVERSHDIMGLDTGLIEDGTYFVVHEGKALAGCGGWSRRRTLFGGDETASRNDNLADPATEPAKMRAMYTHPDYVRRGVGHLILSTAEQAARDAGFTVAELGSTASGLPLYRAKGYAVVEDISAHYDDGVVVPNYRMRKSLV